MRLRKLNVTSPGKLTTCNNLPVKELLGSPSIVICSDLSALREGLTLEQPALASPSVGSFGP
jgi:hypothetical protein